MRFLTYIWVLVLLVGGSAMASPPKGPVLTFTEIFHDFKQIKQDQVVSYIFKFKNTGDQPLVINDVKIPCGCTTPEFPKNPVMPGQEGEVKVTFNPVGQPRGEFRKTLIVHSNAGVAGKEPMLLIKGEITKGKIGPKKTK
jgi:hypothetical protein